MLRADAICFYNESVLYRVESNVKRMNGSIVDLREFVRSDHLFSEGESYIKWCSRYTYRQLSIKTQYKQICANNAL